MTDGIHRGRLLYRIKTFLCESNMSLLQDIKIIYRRKVEDSFREKRADNEIKIRAVSARQTQEPTVPTPHFLFVPPKRKRAVDGTKEKAAGGAAKGWFALPRTPC